MQQQNGLHFIAAFLYIKLIGIFEREI